jgi:UDP-N-acetyl-D-mannosaminuronate dehydrogenase
VSTSVAVIGLGEVGRPLLELIGQTHSNVIGIDVAPRELPAPRSIDVMHICFPFEIEDFVGEATRYVELLDPALTIVNSTVAVGTTRAIHVRTGARVAYSPVRGKHARMLEELRTYAKFVGGTDGSAARDAAAHFEAMGVHTRTVASAEAAELAKLSETTYFGVLIAWAQEVERYCDQFDVEYGDVVAFFEEIGYLPPVQFFPGVIGGHCVMPNIEILRGLVDSEFLDAIRSSNERKIAREELRADSLEVPLLGAQ